jgi:hypothetical protein
MVGETQVPGIDGSYMISCMSISNPNKPLVIFAIVFLGTVALAKQIHSGWTKTPPANSPLKEDCNCENSPDYTLRAICYVNCAAKKKDKNICVQAGDISARDFCFAEAAISSNDRLWCNNVSFQRSKDWCLSRLSKPGGANFCDEIKDQGIKDICRLQSGLLNPETIKADKAPVKNCDALELKLKTLSPAAGESLAKFAAGTFNSALKGLTATPIGLPAELSGCLLKSVEKIRNAKDIQEKISKLKAFENGTLILNAPSPVLINSAKKFFVFHVASYFERFLSANAAFESGKALKLQLPGTLGEMLVTPYSGHDVRVFSKLDGGHLDPTYGELCNSLKKASIPELDTLINLFFGVMPEKNLRVKPELAAWLGVYIAEYRKSSLYGDPFERRLPGPGYIELFWQELLARQGFKPLEISNGAVSKRVLSCEYYSHIQFRERARELDLQTRLFSKFTRSIYPEVDAKLKILLPPDDLKNFIPALFENLQRGLITNKNYPLLIEVNNLIKKASLRGAEINDFISRLPKDEISILLKESSGIKLADRAPYY